MRIFNLIMLTIILIACSKDDTTEHNLNLNSQELVTGIRILDETGQTMIHYGNPCDKTRIPELDISTAFYPNPTSDYLLIHSSANITGVWLIKGQISKQFTNTDFTNYYSNNSIDTTGMSELNILANSAFNEIIDVSMFSGYHKIIMEINDTELVWSTLYFSRDANVFDMIEAEWK
ncbi:hypothetical protein [Carboxylicivirga sp. N1Y90]|uniref:hypothetical protein n=1 Tax=Carboxylicivirga fragile TaxID=3417571 RepID=UPI003D3383B3|nr:hypothetical protein [Marinilabiliaceae bacterium N1Y90]